ARDALVAEVDGDAQILPAPNRILSVENRPELSAAGTVHHDQPADNRIERARRLGLHAGRDHHGLVAAAIRNDHGLAAVGIGIDYLCGVVATTGTGHQNILPHAM